MKLREIKIFILKRVRYIVTVYFLFIDRCYRKIQERKIPDKTLLDIHGSKMELDLKQDQGISHDLYFYGTREIMTVKHLFESEVLKKGDVVLDIGANIGYYALIESQLVGKTGTIYAIEPVSDTYKRLERNISLNKKENIEKFNIGASNHSSEVTMHISRFRNWSSVVNTIPARFSHTENIKVYKMDDFLADKKIPNFIRMDVEGYEYAILEGLQNTLSRQKRGAVLIEIHPNLMTIKQTKKVFAVLKNSNYTKTTIIHEPYRGWLNKRQEIRPIIKFLTKQIGDTEKIKGTQIVNIDEAESICVNRQKLLYAIFEKNYGSDN